MGGAGFSMEWSWFGFIAIGLAEFVGEIRERVEGGKRVMKGRMLLLLVLILLVRQLFGRMGRVPTTTRSKTNRVVPSP